MLTREGSVAESLGEKPVLSIPVVVVQVVPGQLVRDISQTLHGP